MDPEEVELLAEKELVTISPSFRLSDKLYMISGDFGPLEPNVPVQVPLWMAVYLRQRQKCRLQPPEWMNVDELERIKRLEMDNGPFQAMPSPFYREITQAFMTCAADDVVDADAVEALVQDIWDIRAAKIRLSLDQIVRRMATTAQLNGLTQMEINACRPYLREALDQMHSLRAQFHQLRGERGTD